MNQVTKIWILAVLIVAISFLVGTHPNLRLGLNSESPRGSCESVAVAKAERLATLIEDNRSRYASSSRMLRGQSAEGGEQTTYTENGVVVIVREVLLGETGKSEITYYLSDNNPFLIRREVTKYKLPINVDSSGVAASVDRETYYLGEDQALCSWYLNDTVRVVDIKTRNMVNSFVASINQNEVSSEEGKITPPATQETVTATSAQPLASCDSISASDVTSRIHTIEDNLARYASSSRTEKIPELDQIRNREVYSDNGERVIVQDRYLGDKGMSDVSYYLANGRVFFILKYSALYEKPFSEGGSGVIKQVEQRRYYFDDKQSLCRWYLGNKLQSVDSDARDYVKFFVSSIRDDVEANVAP